MELIIFNNFCPYLFGLRNWKKKRKKFGDTEYVRRIWCLFNARKQYKTTEFVKALLCVTLFNNDNIIDVCGRITNWKDK